jgi:hypothetical protein
MSKFYRISVSGTSLATKIMALPILPQSVRVACVAALGESKFAGYVRAYPIATSYPGRMLATVKNAASSYLEVAISQFGSAKK